MKLIRLLSISLLYVLFSLNISAEKFLYCDSRVDITYSRETKQEIDKFAYDLEIVESFFVDIFNKRISEPFSVSIMDSVWELTSTFNTDSSVGAVYIDSQTFFQPLYNLKRKNKYMKTLFTEYAHYYIDYITNYRCPPWLNEGISYYYWLLYSGESPIKGDYIEGIDYLKNFSSYMNNKENMNNYYHSVIIFLNDLFINGNDISDFVLLLNDSSVEDSIKKMMDE